MIPREGISNSMTVLSPLGSMFFISPFLLETDSIAVPAMSDGKSMVNSSTGSIFTPSTTFKITLGWPICNSYPSRRMVSINTDKWSTPRPNTLKRSALSVSWTRNAKFFSNSFSKRSLMWRLVTNLPSRPKNGESLMVNNILIVGSSTLILGNASGFSKSVKVSPISKFSIPLMAQISPETTESTFLLPKPSKTYNSLILPLEIAPSLFTKETFMPAFNSPRCNLPMAMRPV